MNNVTVDAKGSHSHSPSFKHEKTTLYFEQSNIITILPVAVYIQTLHNPSLFIY